jgi:hypothetical protein
LIETTRFAAAQKRFGSDPARSARENQIVAARDRLFEPFVTAGKQDGVGLGLALSRQTVLNQSGDIGLSRPAVLVLSSAFR